MSKRATRWKAEVYDSDDVVRWEVLVHDFPDATVQAALRAAGLKIRRATTPKTSGPVPLTYSELDPTNSITAAREHAARHDTKIGAVLMLLLDADGKWVARAEVRHAGGDQGDKRVRELRARNWPISIAQLAPGQPWHVKLELPRHLALAPEPDPEDQPSLFVTQPECYMPGCPLPVHDDSGMCEPHSTRESRRRAERYG
jgi:hypothetical protein